MSADTDLQMVPAALGRASRRRAKSGAAAARGTARLLCLAAAPTFALMAVLTSVLGEGAPAGFCAAAHGAAPLGGMIAMYAIMSAFHLPPWLKLIDRERDGARRS